MAETEMHVLQDIRNATKNISDTLRRLEKLYEHYLKSIGAGKVTGVGLTDNQS